LKFEGGTLGNQTGSLKTTLQHLLFRFEYCQILFKILKYDIFIYAPSSHSFEGRGNKKFNQHEKMSRLYRDNKLFFK
jgi:hypothetical protein